ncbi:MAG: DUF2304 domain-containing protein [Chloroflexi bacterium]|nr:DUF2304 domain-containing protein [Chloroflexota bacterium]
MTPRQQFFALLIGGLILLLILELIRRRRLREEYSWLWVLTGFVIFLLVVWYDLLMALTRFLGIVLATSTVFFLGVVFLVLVNIHSSVKISTLTTQVKNLAQEVALLNGRLTGLAAPKEDGVAGPGAGKSPTPPPHDSGEG